MIDQLQAIDEFRAWIDRQEIEGVAAVSDCERENEQCIYVYVTSPEAASKLPAEFRGFKIYVEQGDPIHAQGARGAKRQ